MSDRSIYFVTAELTSPAFDQPPFAVLRVDISKRREGGIEATVESLFWSKYVADQIAGQLNKDAAAYNAPRLPA